MNKPITLCDRCDIAASCLLNYDGVPCRKNRTVEPTHADRIRAMTDEELAEWFGKIQYDTAYYCAGEDEQKYPYPDGWLEWLGQEATYADN